MSTPTINLRHFETFSQSYDPLAGVSDPGHLVKDLMAGPCRVMGISVSNVGGSANAVWLKLYDNVSPTVGTTAPDYSFPIPVNFADSIPIPVNGLKFNNGLSYSAEDTGGGTAGTGAPHDAVIVGLTLLEGVQ